MPSEQELLDKAKRWKTRAGPTSNGKAIRPPRKMEVLYDAGKKNFWAEARDNEWVQYSEKSLSRILRSNGFRKDQWNDKGLSLLEEELMRIETQANVDWAGEVAGFKPGLHDIAGQPVLVTRGPELIKAKERPWSTLDQFLEELLGDEAVYFMGWLKCALDALRAGPPWRPGQALCLAGPANCGKSFLQGIITEILGGRTADPYEYLMGESGFNGDLFRAEHLAIGDKLSLGDKKNRKRFGANIKSLLYEEVSRCNAKGKQALSLTPFWRLSISVNDDSEYITLLPPLDGSTRDKFILLRCSRASFPYGSDDLDGRRKYRQAISGELPGFLWWLKTWKIPKDLADRRTGITHYANPELAQKLADFEEEFLLLTLIDRSPLIPAEADDWRGSSEDLRQFVTQNCDQEVTRKLFRFSNAAGVYLSRLAAKENPRVFRYHGPSHTSLWQVFKAGVDITPEKLAKNEN